MPGIVDSFARFALQGLGTPAPIAPPRILVVTGLYRYVRNPIYVALVAIILGQAVLMGDWRLIVYGALLWLFFHVAVVAYEEPTQFTSKLISENESGALNESFSDMMGTSVEFFYRTPPSPGIPQPDYLIGADVIRGPLNGIRSLADPGLFGHPDHYSKRFLGTDDFGFIHKNCGISNNAFYLAIEGGTNRTSHHARGDVWERVRGVPRRRPALDTADDPMAVEMIGGPAVVRAAARNRSRTLHRAPRAGS